METIKCNFCGSKAKYDAKTPMGPWAYYCQMCFNNDGGERNIKHFTVLRQFDPAMDTAPDAGEYWEGHKQEPQTLSFEDWMGKVNSKIVSICGLGYEDLPDFGYRDAYDLGEDPSDVATEVLEEADFY